MSQLDGNAPSESVRSQPPSMVLGDTLVLELQSFRSEKTKALNCCGHLRSDGKTEILRQYPQQTQKKTIIALGEICAQTAKKLDEIKRVFFVFCH